MRGIVFIYVLLMSLTCHGQDRWQLDTRSSGYERFGSQYSRYSLSPPRIYSGGRYLGELSTDRYAPDSVSNPYGRFGSRYSSESINNPYSPYGTYRTKPIWVYPQGR